ncbi:PPC domain-containing DNA-binding protein [Halothermothrix orenii]|uniref:Predicted DNA-binding protein with PD1-like DNA-binding motif n=1 Tax=Halothermothrix orenii (strain H 168 / OCM 544 / DSM 9562) TaxID=373903 RepID=B8CX27_HALOH|nr:PPC domain-containing DNA-binding protein [Halothermothrix orenii]ACL69846.1 predicted DNA-binding protein with PD1-like DNA-binding motif [Halothermothrix orenii H 168]
MGEYTKGRTFLGRLPKGGDLLQELTKVVRENNIETGVFMLIGAVEKAKFGYYLQDEREFFFKEIDEHLEIVSCKGNISLLNGEPFVHAHIIVSDENGNTYGGHLSEETTIFAAEYFIQELIGEKLERTFDKKTGLSLWSM